MRFAGTLGLILPLAIAGCSDSAATPPSDATSTDEALTAPYGGQTAGDEAPGFGDDAFEAGDLAMASTAIPDPTTASASAVARVRLFVGWGFLKPQRDATETVDWSGSIAVDSGVVRIVREVRFEDHDMIVRPRTDAQSFEFESHTRPAMDGVVLEILFAANSTTNLTFTSAPITTTIPITPGDRISEKLPVDDAGHVLAFHTIRPDAAVCTEGFLRGHWQSLFKVGGRDVGVFRGRVLDGTGDVKGSVKGVFGVRADGKKLFFGKMIGMDGGFRALLAGSYDDGDFHGRVLLGGHVKDGVVRGKYETGGDDGGFVGRWSQKCKEDASEGTPMTSDEEQ